MNLTAENVHDIFKKCLSNDSVDTKIVDIKIVNGVNNINI